MATISRENNFKKMQQDKSNNSQQELIQSIQSLMDAEQKKANQSAMKTMKDEVKKEVTKQVSSIQTQMNLDGLQSSFQQIIDQQTQIINLLTMTDENGKQLKSLPLIYQRLQSSTSNSSKALENSEKNTKKTNEELKKVSSSLEAVTATIMTALTALDPKTAKTDAQIMIDMLKTQLGDKFVDNETTKKTN